MRLVNIFCLGILIVGILGFGSERFVEASDDLLTEGSYWTYHSTWEGLDRISGTSEAGFKSNMLIDGTATIKEITDSKIIIEYMQERNVTMQGSGVYVNKKYDDSYTDIWTETIDRQTLTCLSFVNGSEKIEYLAQKPTRYFISTSIEENQKIPYLCPTSFTMVKEQKLSYMRSESLKLVDCSVKYDNMNIQGNNVQAIVLLNQNEFSDEHTNESYNQIFKFEKTTGLLSSFSVKSSIFAWGVDGSYWERRIEETGAYEVKTISWNISQPSPTPYSTESTPTITTTTKETPTSTPSPSPTQQLIQPTGFDMNTIVLVAIIIIVIAAAAFFITKRKKS